MLITDIFKLIGMIIFGVLCGVYVLSVGYPFWMLPLATLGGMIFGGGVGTVSYLLLGYFLVHKQRIYKSIGFE